MDDEQRYAGRPLVRLLELYVLHAIGEIDPADAAAMQASESEMQRLYQHSGAWYDIVADDMKLPKRWPEEMRELWRNNCERAAADGVELSAEYFARLVVDANILGESDDTEPD